jgi:DUF971 family protein
VRPIDVQQIGDQLAVKWDDNSESYILLEKFRRACPCAGCKGEVDVMGNRYMGSERPLSPQSFILSRIVVVGGYALQPFWADGHSTGLFAFDYLKRVGEAVTE